jgi:hypothetical protein
MHPRQFIVVTVASDACDHNLLNYQIVIISGAIAYTSQTGYPFQIKSSAD